MSFIEPKQRVERLRWMVDQLGKTWIEGENSRAVIIAAIIVREAAEIVEVAHMTCVPFGDMKKPIDGVCHT